MKMKRAESFALLNGDVGDVFYTCLSDASIQSTAGYLKRKVKTERTLVLQLGSKVLEKITKVTILV